MNKSSVPELGSSSVVIYSCNRAVHKAEKVPAPRELGVWAVGEAGQES